MRRAPPTQGSAVMTALVASAVTGFVLLGVILVVKNMSASSARNRLAMARDNLINRVSSASRQPMNLQASAQVITAPPQPVQYGPCVRRNAAPIDCNTPPLNAECCVPDGVWREFTLVDAKMSPIAGTTANPVRYDLDLRVCGAPSQQCPFEARAEFRATCNPGPNCDVADLLDVRTDVRVAPGVLLRAGGVQVGLRAAESVDKALPVPELFKISGREVAAGGAKTCEAGFEFRGIDEFGRPVCVQNLEKGSCGPNSFVTGVDFANKDRTCAQIGDPAACPDGTYFAGWLPNGSPVCHPWAPLIDQRIHKSLTKYQANFDRCPPDQVSVGLNPDGSNLCEPLHFSIGTIGMNGPAALGAQPRSHLVAVPWTPLGARCAINFDNFVGGDHYGLCNCQVSVVQPGSVLFHTYYDNKGMLNPAQNACGFTYFIWGAPNESGP